MTRNFLGAAICLFFMISCNNDCEDSPPEPISFNIQWVDSLGNDMYEKKDGYDLDSLVSFYNKTRGVVPVTLEVKRQQIGDSLYYSYINVMPLVRVAHSLQIDSVFIGPNKTDVDTIILRVIKDNNDCFSTVYQFQTLEYNGEALSGVDSLYIIEK